MENNNFVVRAKAKVNLALHIVGQRRDGMHLLDSIVAFPEVGDELSFLSADDLSLSISGPFGGRLSKEISIDENSIIRAAKLLKGGNKGVAIKLVKNLPIASGIGGGSSNAAATIKALSKLWLKPMPTLDKILTLGADVPVCLSNKLQRMQGIGEIRTVLSEPPPIWIVLVNPGVSIPTYEIFNLLEKKENKKLEELSSALEQECFFKYLERQRNDLEPIVKNLFPQVETTLQVINDTRECKVCRMSGSGATCFGLYSKEKHALTAEKVISESLPKAWVKSALLFSMNTLDDIIC